MSEQVHDPLKKSEIKWWWPVLILAMSFAAMYGSLRYEVTTCSVEIDALQVERDRATAAAIADRILIESRMTRMETKIDSILQAVTETH